MLFPCEPLYERIKSKKKIVKLKLPRVNDTPKIHLRSLGNVNFIDTWLDQLKLLRVNDTPKIHLRSLGSVNFIDAWQVHKYFVKLTENCQNQVCKHKFTTRISYSVPRGNIC